MFLKKALVLSIVGLIFFVSQAMGQDPVPLYPENYKIFVENDRVRVMDFQLKKGATEKMHAHPAHVLYVLTGFKIRFTFPDGTTRIRETKTGDVLYSEAVMHSPLNIGDTDAHGILVELKTQGLSSDDFLTAVTFIKGMEGKEDELKRELLALEAPTRAEPGCITYDLYQSPDRKNEFMRFEVWRNPEALEAHKITPHLQASFLKRKEQGWMTQITTWKRVRQ